MSEEKHLQQDEAFFKPPHNILKKIFHEVPSDGSEIEEFEEKMCKTDNTRAKTSINRACLRAIGEGRYCLERLLNNVDDYQIINTISHLCPDELDCNRRKEYEELLFNLTILKEKIKNKKIATWEILDSLMKEISMCVNLPKDDFPKASKTIDFIRDMDSFYGQLSRPIPLSIHVCIFMLIYNCVDVVNMNIDANSIQRKMIELFSLSDDIKKAIDESEKKILDVFSKVEHSQNDLCQSFQMVDNKLDSWNQKNTRSISQKRCAEIIIKKAGHLCLGLKKANVLRVLSDWDTGKRKAPPVYFDAKGSEMLFEVWAATEYVKYYHSERRGRNKKASPRKTKSSSDAAIKEASIKNYKDNKE